MKKFIIIIIFFTFSINYSQTKILKKNINELNIKIENLNLNIDTLKSNIKKQKLATEKLRTKITFQDKDLLFYKVKEDYYATAISEQSTRFALIISAILALFTFISFKSFKSEVSKIKKRTEKQIKKVETEFIEYKDKLTETSNDLTRAKGNIYASIAVYFRDNKSYESAFRYQLLSAKEHGFHKENNTLKDKSEETDYKTCIANLKLSLKHLNQTTIKLEQLTEDLDKTKGIIDSLSTLENEEVKNLTAKIRILLNEKINVA